MDLIIRDKISKILHDGEEMLFESDVGDKNSFLLTLSGFVAILCLILPVFLYLGSETIIQYLGATVLTIFCVFIALNFFVRDSQNMILTNRRIIIYNSLFKKVENIEFSEILSYKAYVCRSVPLLKIFTEKKEYTFCFLDIKKFTEEFQKTCPDFVSRGDKKVGASKNFLVWTLCVVFIFVMFLYVREDISLKVKHRQEFSVVMKNPEYRNYMENIYKNIEDILFSTEPPTNIVISLLIDKDGNVLKKSFRPVSSINNDIFQKVSGELSFKPSPEVTQKLKPYIVQIEVKTEGEKVMMSMKTNCGERYSSFVMLMSSSYGK